MPIEEIVLSSTVDFSPSLFGWSRDVEVDLNLLGMRIHVRSLVAFSRTVHPFGGAQWTKIDSLSVFIAWRFLGDASEDSTHSDYIVGSKGIFGAIYLTTCA